MKKGFRIMIIICAILLVFSCVFLFKTILCTPEERNINLVCIGETNADFSNVYDDYEGALGEKFIWWYQAKNMNELEHLKKRFGIATITTNIDFKDNYVVVSMGCPLNGLVYNTSDMRQEDKSYHAHPIFQLDAYKSNYVYIYIMDRIRLIDTEFYGTGFQEQNYKDKWTEILS